MQYMWNLASDITVRMGGVKCVRVKSACTQVLTKSTVNGRISHLHYSMSELLSRKSFWTKITSRGQTLHRNKTMYFTIFNYITDHQMVVVLLSTTI